MVTAVDGAADWLSVAPVDAWTPPVGFHPGVDEWLDIAGRERRARVIPEVPVLVGLLRGGTPGVSGMLDVRVVNS